MTVSALSLTNSIVYENVIYEDISSLFFSSILFNFTDSHNGSLIYNIDLGIYNIAMSNSMLFYRNNEPVWSLGINKNLRILLSKNSIKYRQIGLSRKSSFHEYDHISSHNEFSSFHFNHFDIPKEKLFNFSVAVKIINRTIYPNYSPSSSGGVYGIIQQ